MRTTLIVEKDLDEGDYVFVNTTKDGVTSNLCLTPEAYMHRFKQQARECICHAYEAQNLVCRSSSTGTLSTSLAEDVIYLINSECKVLEEYLKSWINLWQTRRGNELYVDGLLTIFRCLYETHVQQRPLFLTTLSDCCAAANDFLRLADKMETLLTTIFDTVPMFQSTSEGQSCRSVLRKEVFAYLLLLNQDAVMAAEQTHIFLMRNLNKTNIPFDLFSRAWEDDCSNMEGTQHLIKTVDHFLAEIYSFLGCDFLRNKALVSTCKAVVCFYIRCLIERTDSIRRSRRNRDRKRACEKKPFQNAHRALFHMLEDITNIKEYFDDLSCEMTAVNRIICNEVFILELIYECLNANDGDSLETLIVVLHKRTGANALVTRYLITDLWTLFDRREEETVLRKILTQLHPDLKMVSSGLETQLYEHNLGQKQSKQLSLVDLDDMLKGMYEDRVVLDAIPFCWSLIPKNEESKGKRKSKSKKKSKVRALTRTLNQTGWNFMSAH